MLSIPAIGVIAIIILIAIGVAAENESNDGSTHPRQGYGHEYNLD